MPTREQVLAAIGAKCDYFGAGKILGIPAGQAYLVATGRPADGGDTFPPEEIERPGVLATSTQHLVYAKREAENPTAKPHVHEWIKRRVAGDEQAQQAARARDAAPGEPVEPDVTDVSAVLTRDHDQVTAMLQEMKTIPGVTKGGSEIQQSRRKSIVDMITVALSKHESSEEEEFWPVVRSALAQGDAIADEALHQEQEGKDVLNALGPLPPSEEEFDELAEKLETLASRHVAFEDRVLLALGSVLSDDERSALGARIQRAEKHAPTRPHPHAPKEHAAAVKAAGAAAAAMDRVRDSAGNRPAKRRGKAKQEPDAKPGGEE